MSTAYAESPQIQLDKVAVLRSFNALFNAFIDDLILVLPENPDVKAARVTFDTVRKANPTAIVKVWHKYIFTPYGDSIDAGQIHFFLDKDYSHDVRNLKNPNKVLEVINTIRDPIRDMGATNHQHVANYLQKLCMLAKLYEPYL
jgi:hypothetical protein